MALLTRSEAMARLRVKSSYFSKIMNGKVKGVTPPPCVRMGRLQHFREESLEQWIIEREGKSCSADR